MKAQEERKPLALEAKAAEEEDEDYEYGNRDYTDAGTVAGGNAQD